MNEELLQKIYSKYGADKGTYEQFSSDMQLPEVRRKVYDKYLTDKGSYEQFESDLGVGQTVQADVQPPQQQTSFWGKLGNALKTGWDAGKTVNEGIDILTRGQEADEESKQALSQIIQRQSTLSPEESFQQIRHKEDGTPKGFMELTLKEKAGYIAELGLQSGAQMVSSFLDSFTSAKTASALAGGAALGAAGGSAVPLLGNAIMGGLGAIATVSGLMETSSFVMEELQTELQKQGLKGTVEDITKITSNEEWMNETRRKGVLRGVAIGGVDFVTGIVTAGIGAKVAGKVVGKGLGLMTAATTTVKGAVRAKAVDLVGGGAGERLGQVAAGQPYDYLAVEAEVLGEIFGAPVEFASPFIKPLLGGQIVDAKNQRIAAEKTGTPITKEIEQGSNETLGVSHLVEGIQTDNLEMVKHSLASLAAAGHDMETFSGMLEIEGKIRGLSPEAMQSIIPRYEQAKTEKDKFNTPELLADPIASANATKLQLDANQLDEAKTKIEEQKAASNPILHPKWDEQLADIDERKAGIEEELKAVVSGKKLEVSDDPVFYRTRLEEEETSSVAEENALTTGEAQIFELGSKLSDSIAEQFGEEQQETTVDETPTQKVLYNGVEFEVTNTNKDGTYDLSSRDGKFVKGADPADAEWQGFVDQQPQPAKSEGGKKLKRNDVAEKWKKTAEAISTGNLKTRFKSIGSLLKAPSIPDFIYAKLGDGDILAGKTFIENANKLHGEVEALQNKLTPEYRTKRKARITGYRSRIETLDKQAVGQEPAQESESKPRIRLSNEFTNTAAAKEAISEINTLSESNPLSEKQRIIDGVKIEVEQSGGNILLKDINAIEQGKGNGTGVLNKIKAIADEKGVGIIVYPEQTGTTTKDQLVSWYKKNGFQDYTQGRLIYKPTTDDTTSRQQTPESAADTTNLAEEPLTQETLPSETTKKLEDLSREVTMKAETASDLYLINRRIWGLTHEQAIETAVIQDRLISFLAKRDGVSKSEIYARESKAFQKDGVDIQAALTDTFTATPIDQLIGVLERYLTDAERTSVLAEFGGKTWTTETSEFFARGFERYLLDGVAPTPELQSTFEKFKKWLTDIYLGIKNSVIDTPISVAMENLYASFLTDDQLNNATNQPDYILNHRQIEELREQLDMEFLNKNRISRDASIKDAQQNHISKPEDNYAKELALALDAMNGMPLDAPRQLAISHAIKRLKADRSTAEQQLRLAQKKYFGLGGDVGAHRGVLAAINEDIEALTRGLYRAGSTLGRALAVRKEILENSAWDPAIVEERLKDNLKDVVSARDFEKGVINEEDRATIRKLTDKVNQLKLEVDALVVKDDTSASTAKRMVAAQEVKKPRGKSVSGKISTSRSLKAAKAQLDNVLAGKIC